MVKSKSSVSEGDKLTNLRFFNASKVESEIDSDLEGVVVFPQPTRKGGATTIPILAFPKNEINFLLLYSKI
ncbi:hypothetical protein T190820D02B_30149 [Tenacibaculum sp. 190524A05c]